ncbi:hypothetical protein K0M31_001851 [Melipona bicolor]|uniref:Uncharacterized protein n=1 Tax=Melipona bicolor TaxID=60889 RepID=A0AA40GGN7_9HYME|nr:hypothetical protein K0M31_001851 [Melipona bicolor]
MIHNRGGDVLAAAPDFIHPGNISSRGLQEPHSGSGCRVTTVMTSMASSLIPKRLTLKAHGGEFPLRRRLIGLDSRGQLIKSELGQESGERLDGGAAFTVRAPACRDSRNARKIPTQSWLASEACTPGLLDSFCLCSNALIGRNQIPHPWGLCL